MRVIAYLGVLQVLEEQSLLKHVREFCGVSAGALVALMLALGYSLKVLERFCFEFDFTTLKSIDPDTIFECIDYFGLDNGDSLVKLIQKILHHKGFPPSTTFKDLREKDLRVWASDLQTAKLVEYSYEKTPDTTIIFAIRASMAFPLYYTPMKDPQTGHMLVDGGLCDNYPIMALNPEEREESVGLAFAWSKIPMDIPDITKYVGLMVSGFYLNLYQLLLEQHRNKTILIPCGEFPALHFEATLEERQGLVECGRLAAIKFLNTTTKPLRRSSVS
jgi:predicted acylesterase/phospholipase RssA